MGILDAISTLVSKALDSGVLPPAKAFILLKEVDVSKLDPLPLPPTGGSATPPPLVVLHGQKLYTIVDVFTDRDHAEEYVYEENLYGHVHLVSCTTNQPRDAVKDEGDL